MQVSQKAAQEIVSNLGMGFKCFIHVNTLEIIDFPDPDQFYGDDMEDWKDAINKVEANPEKYKEIEKMSSSQGFRMMEEFIETIDYRPLKIKLLQALEGRKPFANFKFQIDQSGPFREMWFAFKDKKMIEWINDQLKDDDDQLDDEEL